MTTFILAVIFGGLVGLLLGALGGGGSILVVPVLIYGLAIPDAQATTMSLVIVGCASLLAATLHYRVGNVELGWSFSISLWGTPGIFLGRFLVTLVPGAIRGAMAVILVIAGALMLRKAGKRIPQGDDLPEPTPRDDAKAFWESQLKMAPIGFIVGLLTGFIGVGGGFLIVPALSLAARLPIKKAIGSSLLSITLNCVISLAYSVFKPSMLESIDWGVVVSFTAAALIAAALASRYSQKFKSANQQRAFALLVLLLGCGLLVDAARKAFF